MVLLGDLSNDNAMITMLIMSCIRGIEHNTSYSTGDYAQVIPVVGRSNHFERTMAPTFAGFFISRFFFSVGLY